MKIKFNVGKFIIKPIIATVAMGFCSIFLFRIINGIIPERLATIIAILFAVVIYVLAIAVLKVFTKKEIKALPMGEKICRILERAKIY